MYSLYYPGYKVEESCGDWFYKEDAKHCQYYAIEKEKIINQDISLSIVINPSIDEDNKVRQSIYLNGVELGTSFLDRTYYNNFVADAKKLNYLELGRTHISGIGNWCYLQGLCYSMRIYNRALNSGEIKQNYDSETAFHKYIVDSKQVNN